MFPRLKKEIEQVDPAPGVLSPSRCRLLGTAAPPPIPHCVRCLSLISLLEGSRGKEGFQIRCHLF